MTALLRVEALGSHYGPIAALTDVSLEVAQGELVALVGANGAGKTTLLRTLSGVQPASSGTLFYDGAPITTLSPAARVRRGIVQVPEGRQVFSPMTVEDNLLLGAYSRRNRRERLEDLAAMFALFPRLAERRRQPAGTLSGGEQQMLAMARALMARPKLLLLDEPSMGLAPKLVDQILETVANLRRQGVTLLLVEQNAYGALSIADRGYVLETGRIVLRGRAEDLRTNPDIRAAYLGL